MAVSSQSRHKDGLISFVRAFKAIYTFFFCFILSLFAHAISTVVCQILEIGFYFAVSFVFAGALSISQTVIRIPKTKEY